MSKKTQAKYELLREQLVIDKNALDEELVRHPQYMLEVGEHVGAAASKRDSLRDSLRVLKGAESHRIREILTKEREKKPTEAEIAAAVDASDAVCELADEIAEAVGEHQRWEMLYDAVRARGSMLRDLVQMYIAGVSATSAVHDADEARRKLAQKRRDRNET